LGSSVSRKTHVSLEVRLVGHVEAGLVGRRVQVLLLSRLVRVRLEVRLVRRRPQAALVVRHVYATLVRHIHAPPSLVRFPRRTPTLLDDKTVEAARIFPRPKADCKE